ncbi:MAG: IS3 family transposase, partial [Deltaproteobacteria bacterium]
MTEHRKRYSSEFKAEAVRLMQTSDKPVAEIAEDLGISEQSLYRWARQ